MSHAAPSSCTRILVLLAVVLSAFMPVALGQANVQGQWSTLPYLMPINPVHSALLHNGKVLVVAGSGNCPPTQSGCPSSAPYGPANNSGAAIWDPATGTITQFTVNWDMFCNGMVVLLDGRAFINGGTLQYDPFHGELKSSVFDPTTNTFTDVQSMAHGRWYPTVTNLGDGRVMTFSGLDENGNTSTAIEFYTVGSGWSQQFSAGWTPPLYPRMHLLPNGKVFYSGSGTSSAIFDPSTTSWTLNVATTKYGGQRTYGSSVLLPLTPANNYDPKVLIMGGGNPSTATSEIIDLGAPTPAWQFGPNMSQPRIEMNATILPNGKVLAMGGSLNDEDTTTASLNADLYDPATNKFSSAGANAYARLYHSVALLLPDATVWFAGGNPNRGEYEQHMEIYKPPYLFNPDGSLALRPTITSAPGSISYGNAFTVQTPDAASISSVVLMRPGAPTHAFDQEQRLVGMSFTAGSGTLTITAPPNGNIAPPGYYMLFILNNSGVPSIAQMVQIGQQADTQPPTAPTNLLATAVGGSQINLNWTASTDNVGVTQYLVERCQGAGCTSFVQVGASTGTTYTDTGLTPTTSYSYRVRATDAAGNLSTYSNVASANTQAPDTQPPTAPTNLTATAISNSQINLSWTASTDNVGVTQYLVERCQGTGCTTFVQVGTSTGTTYNDTGLTNATSYSYRVRATDAAGNLSAYSNVASATTQVTIPGLVAAYSFNEGTGTTVGDSSGTGNTGTVANTTWTTSGKFGNGLVFNGTSAKVTIPDAVSLHLTNGMTLEAWVNPATVSSAWRDVIYKGDDNYYLEGTSTNGTLPAGGGTWGGTIFGTAALTANTWAHLALTYDGLNLRLYVNGVQAASQAQTGNIATSANPLQVGGDSIYGQYFQGTIDEVRVYNVALTAVQIQSDMVTPIGGGGGGGGDTQPPTAPTNLTATAVSGSQINLSWTASTDNVGVTQYLVERCQGAGCTTFAQIGTSAGTTYNDTGLTNATSYSYRVRATDAAGNLSGYSNTASTTTADTQPPTAPTNFTATATSGTQINLSWTASTDNVGVTQYLVERCQGAGCTTFAQIGTSTTTTFNNTGLTNATSYSYRVRATDAAGNLSGSSNTASATTTDTQPPTAPTSLTATATSGTQINLSWTASTDNVGVTQYLVERCQGAGCTTFAQIGTSAGATLSDTGLAPNTSYSYRVRATDAAGNLSSYSNVASATTQNPDTQPPTAPTNLLATAASTSQINLSWTASTDNVGVTQYLVERCQGTGCTTFTQIGTSAGTTFNDTGLTPTTSYSYRVRATDAAGNLSTYSNVASATTQAPDTQPPTAPTNLTATAISNSQINLSWTASTDNVGVTQYLVERCQGAGCTTFAQVGTSTGTTYNDTGLTNATSYSYRARATDAAGNLSAYSNVASATTQATIPGLVAAYSFNEGTGTTVGDSSGTGNTGTVANTTWTTSGKFGNGLVFNGTSALVTIPDASSLHLTNGVTLEAWVNPTTVSNAWRDVIYKGSDNYYLEATSTKTSRPAGGGKWGSKQTSIFGTTALTAKTWAHLALTYDGANLRLYVNGVQVASQAQTGNLITSSNPLQVGGDSIFGQFFRGTIDEVRVYNVALTAAQIQSDMVTPIGGGGGGDTQPPTAPTNLTATATSGTQINLSWTASTDNVGVTQYLVERCQGAGCTTFAQIGTSAGTTYNDTGLTNATSYSYRVRATDAAGNLSGYSNTASATTADTQPPTAPTNLTATATSGTQINLSWTASTDNVGVTQYLVERCQGAGCTTFAQVGTSAGAAFNDTGLAPNTSCSYRVRATDAAGNLSSYSNVASATTQNPDTQPPTAPTNLTATAASTSQINLSWTASTDNVGVTQYLVERCQGTGCTTFAQVGASTGTTYTDTGLTPTTSYSYRVRATDAAGNLSAYSNVAGANTQAPDTQPPTAPTNLTATAISNSQINLSWTASTDNVGVTQYLVERCQGAGCTTFAQVGTSTGTTYNDPGLTNATSYSYRARATDAAGNLSAYSNVASATTQATIPGLVAAYSFNEGTGTTVGDSSGTGNTGTVANTTWTTSGKFGNGLVFNGSSAKVTIPDAVSLHLTNGMTLEAWVNPATVSSAWRDVIYKGDDNYYLEGTSTNGTLPAGGGTWGGTIFGTTALTANTWAHLALTYDGLNLRLYVNGVQAASQAQTGNIATSANPLQVGGDSIYGQYFQGTIDEVRVYNVALTAAQIQSDMVTPIGGGGGGGGDTQPPTAPTNLTATAVSGSQINLNWTASTDNVGVTQYLVERCQGAGCTTFAQIGTSAGTTYNDTGLTNATSYSYRVRATDAAGNLSGYSNTASAGTGTGFAVIPRAVALTFIRTQQFTASGGSVTWSVDGVTGGSVSSGTITTTGLYTPPTATGTHIVTATTTDLSQSASATVYITNYPGTFTHHNDNLRTGQNTSETVLTPGNVNQAQFGKLFSYAMDGIAFASPLYVANVSIPGQGFHNVVYVATEHDSVYAWDADGLSASPLWQVSFLGTGVTTVPCVDTGECGDIPNEIGITGTPVIDQASGTLYVVAKTKKAGNYTQSLHALDITTGAEKFGGPVAIQASVPGSGEGSQAGQLPFDALRENQRPALVLSNGVLYIGWGSHGDQHPWHGWVIAYNATTLQQVMAYCVSPDNYGGGIWASGGGLGADANGNIYFNTGNGDFTANTGGRDYGDSVVKLGPSGSVLDYFTPFDQANMESQDLDLASAGPVLLVDQPGTFPHLLISSAKTGTIYVVNRDNMGHFNASNDNQIIQSLPGILPHGGLEQGNFSAPAFFNGYVYFAAVSDTLKAFQLSNGLLSSAPTSQSLDVFGNRGGAFAVSGNGNTNGIVWAVQDNNPGNGVLHAYDAGNLSNEFYNTNQAGSRDTLGVATKFSIPLVANGKVFVGSQSQLIVYGLLP